jgi:hypothetical protein
MRDKYMRDSFVDMYHNWKKGTQNMQPVPKKVLPPKGAETWTMISPETPQAIKRMLQFAKDPHTNTIYISNIGSSPVHMQIESDKLILYPVETTGSFVTSTDFARKIWVNLTAAGYKPI